MTQEKFKSLIEAPYNYEDRTFAKYCIARTVRLVLENIDLAKEWYDNLPKAVMDNEKIPTITEMEKMNDNIKELTTVLNVAEKTLGFEMTQVKAEDIPDTIANILEKVAKRKVKVEGNGITEDIKVKVLDRYEI
jgi:hypothetical protein